MNSITQRQQWLRLPLLRKYITKLEDRSSANYRARVQAWLANDSGSTTTDNSSAEESEEEGEVNDPELQ